MWVRPHPQSAARVAGVAGEVEPRQVAPGAQTEQEGRAHVPALGPASPHSHRRQQRHLRHGDSSRYDRSCKHYPL
jgi:hypothetical protein